MTKTVSVGLDFDNTLVSFDEVFYHRALQKKLIDEKVPPLKKSIRDAIRQKHGNEVWTELQAMVYTEGIKEARMPEGCENFLMWMSGKKIPFYIISHKAALSAHGNLDLRGPARVWLQSHGFFDQKKYGLDQEKQVFFEASRSDKLARIAACACEYYIDDLEEVFLDPEFPDEVKAIYYCPHRILAAKNLPHSFQSWKEILDFFQSRHGL